MKKTIVLSFLLLGIVLGIASLASDSNLPRPRFEEILEEAIANNGHLVEVLHDRETGQEVICIFDKMAAPSCYLTGRSWK
jgi:hypothetical protein